MSPPSQPSRPRRPSGRTRLETPASIFKGLIRTPRASQPTITRPAPAPVWPWVIIGIVIGAAAMWLAVQVLR